MKTEFARITYENKATSTAETEQHQAIIRDFAARGYRYAGFVPVRFGPSGKMLVVDLVFEAAE